VRNTISPRQREVLQLLADDRSMGEVANKLKVRRGTVAFHNYKTLDIKTSAELIRYAYRQPDSAHYQGVSSMTRSSSLFAVEDR
jgi:DNA-binding CsgD family transcriptional regulator